MLEEKMHECPTTSHLSKVRAFFTQRSVEYQSDSGKFPWSWLRRREGNAVRRALGKLHGKTVLDLGAGAGFYSRIALDEGAKHVFAVDLSGEMLQNLSSSSATLIVGDAAACALGRTFETIVCAGMLEFVSDPIAVLANARRHATSDSRIVVLAPAKTFGGLFYRKYHMRNGLSISIFTKDQLISMAEKVGWKLESYLFVWPFTHVARFNVKP